MYSSVCGILIVQTQCAITMADVYKYPFVWVRVHSVVIVSPGVGIKPKLVKNNVSIVLFDRKGFSFMTGFPPYTIRQVLFNVYTHMLAFNN